MSTAWCNGRAPISSPPDYLFESLMQRDNLFLHCYDYLIIMTNILYRSNFFDIIMINLLYRISVKDIWNILI